MTDRDAVEAEARALLGEAIGTLEVIAHTTGHIDKLIARKELILAIRKLELVDALLLRLP